MQDSCGALSSARVGLAQIASSKWLAGATKLVSLVVCLALFLSLVFLSLSLSHTGGEKRAGGGQWQSLRERSFASVSLVSLPATPGERPALIVGIEYRNVSL